MKFGVRAHDHGRLPVELLAERIASRDIHWIQLALAKAIEGIGTEPGTAHAEMARGIRNALREKDISIAVLGCYINPIHPDLTERKAQMTRFKEHLRFANDFGCKIVGIEGATTHILHTPQVMKRLLDIFPSDHIKVIFDPVNFLSPSNWTEQEKVFTDSMELFADRICAVLLEECPPELVKDSVEHILRTMSR